jgi:hypothetical protein
MYYHEPIYAQSSSASSSRIVDYDRGGGGATVHYRAIPPRGDLYSEAKRFTWNEQVRIWRPRWRRRRRQDLFLLPWNLYFLLPWIFFAVEFVVLVVMEIFLLTWNLYFLLPWNFFCRGICIFCCRGFFFAVEFVFLVVMDKLFFAVEFVFLVVMD